MKRPYANVDSVISPNQFRNFGGLSTATDLSSHSSVVHEAIVTKDIKGRYEAAGAAEDRQGYTSRVEQPGSYRTPLRAKVAAIHAGREAVSRLGYTN